VRERGGRACGLLVFDFPSSLLGVICFFGVEDLDLAKEFWGYGVWRNRK
jgi:hypothetical protein